MKKGFTLIELLAVIVILAIISLIAVPIVIHIINDTKTSSEEQTVELYINTVEKAITKKQMDDSNFNPDKCKVQKDGSLKCFKKEQSLGIVEIEMKGQVPSSGTIIIKNNKVYFRNLFYLNKFYHKNINSYKVIQDVEKYAELVDDADNNDKISKGDKYTYKVNDIDTFNFYVLTEPKNNQVNLIMDRNICDNGQLSSENRNCNCSWNSSGQGDNTYGPNRAMNFLYEGTKDWINVPTIELNYNDESNEGLEEKGYTNIVVSNGVGTITGKPTTKITLIGTSDKPVKARLPMQVEIQEAGCTTSYESCPSWLIQNLSNENKQAYNSNSYISGIKGYWLLSSWQLTNSGSGFVYSFGNYRSYDTRYVRPIGVRPVITVPKSYLE